MANEHIREATKKIRLIDANALLNDNEMYFCKPCKAKGHDYHGVACRACWVDDMRMAVEDATTVDAVEVVHGRCDWCKPGEELCGTCRMFFDYYGDGGSDSCSSECCSHKCAYYEPIGFCPNCGAKMDGDGDG